MWPVRRNKLIKGFTPKNLKSKSQASPSLLHAAYTISCFEGASGQLSHAAYPPRPEWAGHLTSKPKLKLRPLELLFALTCVAPRCQHCSILGKRTPSTASLPRRTRKDLDGRRFIRRRQYNPAIIVTAKKMDDYRELQVLGQGSFGQVCQVRRVVDGSVCCIKRVPLTGLRTSVMHLSLSRHVSVLQGEIMGLH